MAEVSAQTQAPEGESKGRFNRFDNPWLNPKLLWGVGILLGIILLGIIGRLIWNTELVFTGSTPLRLPPLGFENLRGQPGEAAYPLGTDGAGRDLLALLIIGAPNTLMIGAVASLIGMTTGIVLGFSAGFIGGRTDDVIRILSDVMITIPPLLILVVFQSVYGDVSLILMAFLIAGFMWQSPTRLIRAQVLSMRESGYVKMAQLSGALTDQSLEHVGKLPALLSLDKVKLRRPVTPGDQLLLEAESVRIRSRIAHMRCRAYVAEDIAAEAEVKFMMVDDEAE